MSEITRVGVDLAKNVIQVHGVDATGKVIANRALARKAAPRVAVRGGQAAAGMTG